MTHDDVIDFCIVQIELYNVKKYHQIAEPDKKKLIEYHNSYIDREYPQGEVNFKANRRAKYLYPNMCSKCKGGKLIVQYLQNTIDLATKYSVIDG